eukprot:scaffold87707_cov65-Phaeocystis_antarctica.AAC.2
MHTPAATLARMTRGLLVFSIAHIRKPLLLDYERHTGNHYSVSYRSLLLPLRWRSSRQWGHGERDPHHLLTQVRGATEQERRPLSRWRRSGTAMLLLRTISRTLEAVPSKPWAR